MTQPEHKVSFARVENAGSSTPATPLTPATVAPAADTGTNTASGGPVNTTPAPGDTRVSDPKAAPATSSLGFYTGDDEGANDDPRDVRTPRLNLVQGMSKEDLKSIAPGGEFVYKKSLKLPRPLTAVIGGVTPKVWVEKVKWGGTAIPRIARSLEEVAAFGGTDQWKLSKECKDKQDMPVSRLPLFDAHVTVLLFLAKPEGFDDGNFPYVTEDGLAFGPALLTVKSTSFGSFYIPINTERRGLFKGDFSSRYISIDQREVKDQVWTPTVKILGIVPPTVLALVHKNR